MPGPALVLSEAGPFFVQETVMQQETAKNRYIWRKKFILNKFTAKKTFLPYDAGNQAIVA